MEPDGDMEQLFIAPAGEDSEGQGGREGGKTAKKQRGAERGIGESNVSMAAVRSHGRESMG